MSDKKVNWKQKYFELRSKYMNAIDAAHKMGYQEGYEEAEKEAMGAQLQQLEEAAAMGMGGGGEVPTEPGMEGEMPIEEGMEPGMEGEMPVEGEGDELDASIDELEEYVKSEKVDIKKLMKSLHKSQAKISKNKNTSKQAKVIESALKKWDEEDGEIQSDDNDVMGQA